MLLRPGSRAPGWLLWLYATMRLLIVPVVSQWYLMQGCRCDANVEALAQGLGIQPSGFFTLGRAGRSPDICV